VYAIYTTMELYYKKAACLHGNDKGAAMVKLSVRRFIVLLIALVLMLMGLVGTSLGSAFLLAHLSLEAQTLHSSITAHYGVGIFAFGFGGLFQDLALSQAWIRPRRMPVEPETP